METELLLARTKDSLIAAFRTERPSFLGFLSVEEAAFVKNFLDNRNAKYQLYGGEHNAQRVMLCCLPEWSDNVYFPITAVTFSYRTADELRHRDFLGSLMGLGLKRETIGDILIEKGRAVVFLKDDIADFVIQNLTKVGRTGVTAKLGYTQPLPETDNLKDNTVTVASCRLDCVVSACASCSRNTANELIENGFVSVNSVICQKPTKLIVNGDVLSVRKKGKFQIISTDNRTKKDRIILNYKSY